MYQTKISRAIRPRPWHSAAIQMSQNGYGATSIAEALLGRKTQESTVRDFLSKVELSNISEKTKVLFWDIETSPHLSAHFKFWDVNIGKGSTVRNGGILSHAWAWGDGDVHSSVLTPQEALDNDYERIVRESWSLLDNADVVVGHNCLEVSTPVLKSDLTWCAVGDLVVGDELVGFDEGRSPFKAARDSSGGWTGKGTRMVKKSVVTENTIISKEAFEVTLSNGDKVVTTSGHYWLGRAPKDGNYRWYKTSDLVNKSVRLKKYLNVWGRNSQGFTEGWLSGFIAGEGSLKFSQTGVPSAVQICQRPTSVWDTCQSYLAEIGVLHSKPKTKVGGVGRGDCEYVDTLGGKWKTLELVGSLSVSRMAERYDFDNFGSLSGQNLEDVTVVSVEYVGIKRIAVMGTSSSTYFGSGYAMHNCKRFDLRKMNAEFIKLGLPPPSPYKVYDTLRAAKKSFFFDRNDLDSLCQTLKVPHRKVVNEGMPLWLGCINGDQDALNRMAEYNEGDIPTLRAVFRKLLPWDNQGINFAMLDQDLNACPHCGKDSLEFTGKFVYTSSRKYDLYKCSECGANARSNSGEGGMGFSRVV